MIGHTRQRPTAQGASVLAPRPIAQFRAKLALMSLCRKERVSDRPAGIENQFRSQDFSVQKFEYSMQRKTNDRKARALILFLSKLLPSILLSNLLYVHTTSVHT